MHIVAVYCRQSTQIRQISRTILLGWVAIVAFAQTATSPSQAAPPTPPSPAQAGSVPVPTLYRFFSRHLATLDSQAAALDSQGKNGDELRNYYQTTLNLTTAGTASIKLYAANCVAAVKQLDQQAQTIVQQIRAAYPGGLDPATNAPPVPDSRLVQLAQQRDSATNAEIINLQAALSATTFQKLDTGAVEFYIASTYITQSTDVPSIGGVDPSWPADGVLNGSGYTVLYGSNFTLGTEVNISGSGVSMSFSYIGDTQVNIYYTISASASTGAHSLSISNTFGASSPITFTVGDPTPGITSVSPSVWDAGTTTPFTIAGSGFGTSPSLSITGPGITSYSLLSGSDTQISGTVTVAASAPAENVAITITSNGYGGSGFQSNGSGNSSSGSITAQIYPLTVSQSPAPPTTLSLSTGDTNVTMTVGVTPSNITFTPAFSWGLQSYTNSSCPAGLEFTTNSGTGSVNETVTASPAGCAGIFNAEAAVGTKTSGVFTQIIVPPQVLIQMLYGEAHAQAQIGDNVSEPAIGVTARNRFGDTMYFAGSTN